MNFTEYFNFKNKPCTKLNPHDTAKCYFYHETSGLNDRRRQLLNFSLFTSTKKKKDYKLEEVQIYSKEITVDPELDKLLFNIPPSLNETEHKYHILNYKTMNCFFELNSIPCLYKRRCYYLHKDETLDQNIIKFKQFYQDAIKINSIRKSLLNYWNNLINSKTSIENQNEYEDNNYFLNTNLNNKSERPIEYDNDQPFLLNGDQISSKQILDKETPVKINNEIDNYKTNDLHNQTIYKKIKRTQSIKLGQNLENCIPYNKEILYLSEEGPKENEVMMVIFALLNSHFGSLIFGADKNTLSIKGFKMTRKERDFFKQEYNRRFKNYLNFETSVKYKFFDLEDKDGNIIDDICVIYIKVF
jgi:hypothetical protein